MERGRVCGPSRERASQIMEVTSHFFATVATIRLREHFNKGRGANAQLHLNSSGCRLVSESKEWFRVDEPSRLRSSTRPLTFRIRACYRFKKAGTCFSNVQLRVKFVGASHKRSIQVASVDYEAVNTMAIPLWTTSASWFSNRTTRQLRASHPA